MLYTQELKGCDMDHLVLCGGIGSRLWPLSRALLPKQFARIGPGHTLFEQTVLRSKKICKRVLVAANEHQSFLALNQLMGIGIDSVAGLVEPVGRNTAPAIALVCMALESDTILLVTPSDHVITRQSAYEQAVRDAAALAESGKLVTFGIKPEYPETGFGYIEAQGSTVLSFREKPDFATARSYVESGRYLWNSGMFCFKAGVFLAELARHAPELFATCQTAYAECRDMQPLRPLVKSMMAIPSISIDVAVMERSEHVAVVPCEIGWSDLGSMDALYDYLPKIDATNAASVALAPVMVNSTGNLIVSDRQVACMDVQDLLIIDTPDALLVGHRGSSQKVKEVYESLRKHNPQVTEVFPTIERPWGNHHVLAEGSGYRARKIAVLPGKRTSLQKHEQRDEQWVVVAGQATVELDGILQTVSPGQSFVAVRGLAHRISNKEASVLILIETQIGTIIDNDMQRLEDDYHL